jgi:hypothetical protein
VLDALRGSNQSGEVLAHTRYLDGHVLCPYVALDHTLAMTSMNYNRDRWMLTPGPQHQRSGARSRCSRSRQCVASPRAGARWEDSAIDLTSLITTDSPLTWSKSMQHQLRP